MIIEFDTKTLKELKISINQLLFIKMLISDLSELKSILDYSPINQADIDNLIKQKILTKDSSTDFKDFSHLIFEEEFLKKLDNNTDFFQQFYDLYPTSVIRTDGIKDYLRGNTNRCRQLYNKIIGKNELKHKHMLECLKIEIQFRKNSGRLPYMKKMYNWLTSQEWLIAEEMIKDLTINSTNNVIAYGTELE